MKLRQIRDYAGELEFDPGELARIEERLDLIYQLGRKYGEGTAKILEFWIMQGRA